MNLPDVMGEENAAAFASAKVRTSTHLEAGRPDGFDAGRNQSAREAVPGRLREAALELAHAAHLACQSQLADHNQAVRQGPVEIVAEDGQGKTEIGGRLSDAHAARDVDEDIGRSELEACPLLDARR